MGRLTEVFEFINAEKAPDQREMALKYSYISKTPELMAMRSEYQKSIKPTVILRKGPK
jgi:hypothetical protein